MDKRTLLGKIYIRGLEEYAFTLDVIRLPKISEKAIPKLYREANRVRKILGKKPKKYFTVKRRKLVTIK